MLGLIALPALLGLALILGVFDGDDDADDTTETPDPSELDEQIVSDNFIGTGANEILRLDAQGGTVNGAGGADTITGSNQGDGLLGGRGDDVIYGRDGDDTVSGDAGNDRVFLGGGNDEYTPDDTPENTAGDDFVRGGAGNDVIIDLLGSNNLHGDVGADILVSFDGLSETGYEDEAELNTNDTLSGGFGNDVLAGDDGDIMNGGAGRDTFIVTDDEDLELDAVRITDFDPAEDTLLVAQLDGLNSSQPLVLTSTSEGISVTYEGREVALLEGLRADSIPDIRVDMISRNDLDDL